MESIEILVEYFFRIILAGVCGGILGYERKHRGKGAGIRTHIIVAISSALMMIVSKYGFNDMVLGDEFKLDPSRVAAQIVSGVGFLGAGMIFIQKKTVQGLTTAAGIWATSGIGMAVGSGLYVIGILTSFVILVVQFITHKNWKIMRAPSEEQILFSIVDNDDALSYLRKYITDLNIEVGEMKIQKGINSCVDVKVTAVVPEDFDILNFMEYDRKYINSIDI